MTYFIPQEMHPDDREKFLAWFKAEETGFEPLDISADDFSVHKGRVSGKQIIRKVDGSALVHGYHIVTVPFTRKQRNPLPEFTYLEV